MTVLTKCADAFTIECARIELISSCFMRAKEIESPGLGECSSTRLLNAPSDLMGMRFGIHPG